jgi:hypothetical protein
VGKLLVVPDIDEDTDGAPDPDAGHGGQDRGTRVGLREVFDPFHEEVALVNGRR